MTTTRREFLEGALGASALLSLGRATPAWLARAALAAPRRAERESVLVVLQLTGGNDGLNTIIPWGDDAYARARPTLAIAPREVHRIDEHLGFHPRMGACARRFEQGLVSIVQGVGCTGTNRSHERAMRIWQSADPERPERETGWLGRVVDRLEGAGATPLPAALVSPIALPLALRARAGIVPALHASRDLILRGNPADPTASRAAAGPLLEHLRRSAERARAASRRIAAVLDAPQPRGVWPDLALAARLSAIVQLIRADLGIRIFFTELGGEGFGGFDNHANQRGNHGALLHQLSASLDAFLAELKRQGLLDRVLLMTFSEFGRTLAENGRRGTGHGDAAPLLLAGGGLRGGLAGEAPDLEHLDAGAPRFRIDFRRVYATVLERWLGLDSAAVLGRRFEFLDLLAG